MENLPKTEMPSPNHGKPTEYGDVIRQIMEMGNAKEILLILQIIVLPETSTLLLLLLLMFFLHTSPSGFRGVTDFGDCNSFGFAAKVGIPVVEVLKIEARLRR